MSKPKDPQSDRDATKAADARKEPTAVGEQGGDRRSGRVAYDSRGNPVWEWQLETGVYTRDVSTQRLKKLDLGELSLADTAIHKKPGETGQRGGGSNPYDKGAGGGFNPYDKGPSGERGFNPYDNARALGNRMNDKPAPTTAKKPTDLRKLDEWMKLKKSVKDKKDP
jgi:hypothetical protein